MARPMVESSGIPGCIFCDIVHHRAPATIIDEDDKTLSFLDLFPVTRGHVLVVPKHHVDRLTDLPESDYTDFLRTLSRVCQRIERLSSHYNVSLNQGALAGQIVFHMHFHVIPRYGEGTPQWSRPRDRLSEADATALTMLLGRA
jgi:histidine triad (HIT) family protein